jgi:hypothetical protein
LPFEIAVQQRDVILGAELDAGDVLQLDQRRPCSPALTMIVA